MTSRESLLYSSSGSEALTRIWNTGPRNRYNAFRDDLGLVGRYTVWFGFGGAWYLLFQCQLSCSKFRFI